MLYIALALYLLGVLIALHRYGRMTDFRGTGHIWRVGLMVALWPVPLLGELARWWGRRTG